MSSSATPCLRAPGTISGSTTANLRCRRRYGNLGCYSMLPTRGISRSKRRNWTTACADTAWQNHGANSAPTHDTSDGSVSWATTPSRWLPRSIQALPHPRQGIVLARFLASCWLAYRRSPVARRRVGSRPRARCNRPISRAQREHRGGGRSRRIPDRVILSCPHASRRHGTHGWPSRVWPLGLGGCFRARCWGDCSLGCGGAP